MSLIFEQEEQIKLEYELEEIKEKLKNYELIDLLLLYFSAQNKKSIINQTYIKNILSQRICFTSTIDLYLKFRSNYLFDYLDKNNQIIFSQPEKFNNQTNHFVIKILNQPSKPFDTLYFCFNPKQNIYTDCLVAFVFEFGLMKNNNSKFERNWI